jgi:hypothetical protein
VGWGENLVDNFKTANQIRCPGLLFFFARWVKRRGPDLTQSREDAKDVYDDSTLIISGLKGRYLSAQGEILGYDYRDDFTGPEGMPHWKFAEFPHPTSKTRPPSPRGRRCVKTKTPSLFRSEGVSSFNFKQSQSTRHGLGFVLVEFVVEGLESDAQFGGGFGFVAVVLAQDSVDDLHFHFTQGLRFVDRRT